MGRYVPTSDIFDKIEETGLGVGGKIQLTNALSKLNTVMEILLKVKPMMQVMVLNG
ncbi:hypothetical protein [Methanobrevibacter sp.]|uniref:hypothetical protein n=1 Tax=Methanobrevibacter sp. TaxID=66852 RepID=UPI00388F2E18